jgi:hypothetical protein
VNEALAKASMMVCAAFQSFGYVGRCSFDFLVLGDPNGDFRCLFTECNGRWGGTSIPMHLVDRVCGSPRPPYMALDYIHPELIGAEFEDLLAQVRPHIYDHSTGQGRFLFYNVGPLHESGKLDVISVGSSMDDAEEAVRVMLPRLLGLSDHAQPPEFAG